jgi:hypothetical protein
MNGFSCLALDDATAYGRRTRAGKYSTAHDSGNWGDCDESH